MSNPFQDLGSKTASLNPQLKMTLAEFQAWLKGVLTVLAGKTPSPALWEEVTARAAQITGSTQTVLQEPIRYADLGKAKTPHIRDPFEDKRYTLGEIKATLPGSAEQMWIQAQNTVDGNPSST